MRVLGALALIAAFALAGAVSLREKRERLCCLREICCALKLLRGEMESCPASIPEMIESLEPNLEGKGKALFQQVSASLPCLGELPFARIWGQAVADSCCSLRGEEKQRLCSLGLVLGRYELAAQLRELGACLTFLESRENEAARLYPSQRRLQMGLALSSGAILAILLL